jgi:hypothetical protein
MCLRVSVINSFVVSCFVSYCAIVPETRLELVRNQVSRDFKSLASTNSATPAYIKRRKNRKIIGYLNTILKNKGKCNFVLQFINTVSHRER